MPATAYAITTFGNPVGIPAPGMIPPSASGLDPDHGSLFKDGADLKRTVADTLAGVDALDDLRDAYETVRDALKGEIPETLKGLVEIAADQAGMSPVAFVEEHLRDQGGTQSANMSMAPAPSHRPGM